MPPKYFIKNAVHPSKVGSFTEYCKRQGYGGVTAGCIQAALKSRSKVIQHRAEFAKAMRSVARHRRK